MRFVKVEELKVRKFQSTLDDISTEDNEILNELELMAIDEISSYLGGRYDVEFMFNQKEQKRNSLLKRLVIDQMICFLFERVNSNEIPDSLAERCEKNLEWLKSVSEGKINPGFPTLDPTLEANTFFRGGSTNRFNNIDNLD